MLLLLSGLVLLGWMNLLRLNFPDRSVHNIAPLA